MINFFIWFSMSANLSISNSGNSTIISGIGIITPENFEALLGSEFVESSISSLTISENVNSITANSLNRLRDYLVEVYLLSIEYLDDNVFTDSFTKLTSVTLGPNIRYIGYNFYKDPSSPNLISLYLPKSLERIHPNTVRALSSFTLEEGNIYYSVCSQKDDKYLLYKNQSAIYAIANSRNTMDIVFPTCMKSTGIFPENYSINSINFNHIEIIDEYATKFIEGSTVKHITGLDHIKIVKSQSLVKLSNLAEVLTFGSSLTDISSDAFSDNTIFSSVNGQYYQNITIGSGTYVVDRRNSTLVQFLDKFKSQSVTLSSQYKLGYGLFRNGNILSVIINSGITEIPSKCFEGAIIGEIHIADTVTVIGDSAFKGVRSNNRELVINLPKNLQIIGNNSFFESSCSISQLFPSTIQIIGSNAFNNVLSSVQTITFPPTLIEIGESAFANNNQLSSINFIGKNNIKKIGSKAFDKTAINKFNVSNVIEEIGFRAFNQKTVFDTDLQFSEGFLLNSAGDEIIYSDNYFSRKLFCDMPHITVLRKQLFEGYQNDQQILSFNDVTEIGPRCFANCVLMHVMLGPNLNTISDSAFENSIFSSLIIKSTKLGFVGDNAFNGVMAYQFDIPEISDPQNVKFSFVAEQNIFGSFSFPGRHLSVYIDSASMETVLNVSGNIIEQNKEVEIVCGTVVIDSSVRILKSGALDLVTANKVNIMEGVESIQENAFGSNIQTSDIRFPKSLNNMTALSIPNGITDNAGALADVIVFDEGSNFKVKNNYIITTNETKLIAQIPFRDANKMEYPTDFLSLNEIGDFAFQKMTQPPNDNVLTIPGIILKVGEHLSNLSYKLVLEEGVRELATQGNNLMELTLPSTLTDIGKTDLSHFYTLAQDGSVTSLLTINNGCTAVIESGNVAYDKNKYHAYKITDMEATALNFDCDSVSVPTIKLMKNLQSVTFSSRVRHFSGSFENQDSLDATIPSYLDVYYTNSFARTPIKGPLRIKSTSKIEAGSLPLSVVHIYLETNTSIDQEGELGYYPWVHVPVNYPANEDVFMGVPVDRDQPEEYNEQITEPGNRLSSGAIAGIVIGVLLVVLIIAIICIFVFHFKCNFDEVKKSCLCFNNGELNESTRKNLDDTLSEKMKEKEPEVKNEKANDKSLLIEDTKDKDILFEEEEEKNHHHHRHHKRRKKHSHHSAYIQDNNEGDNEDDGDNDNDEENATLRENQLEKTTRRRKHRSHSRMHISSDSSVDL